MLLWSQSTGGFFDTAVWKGELPDDAVQITAARHAKLLEGLSAGRSVETGPRGHPVLTPAPRARRS